MTTNLARDAMRIAQPLAAYAAIASLAWFSAEPRVAAETSYLALLAGAVLLAAGALAVRPGIEVGLAALLAVVAAWALPAGTAAGAAMTLVLALALTLVAAGRFVRDRHRVTWEAAVPLALGLQFLFRAESLLAPALSPATGMVLVLLPLLAAMALVVLAERVAPETALLAGAVVVVLGRGWSAGGTLALLALAAVEWARAGGDPRRRWVPLALVLAAAMALDPGLGLLLSLVVVGRVLADSLRGTAVVVAAAAGLTLFGPAARGWNDAIGSLSWGPILLPAMIVLLPGRWRHLLIAAALGIVAARTVAIPEAIAAPIAFAALALPAGLRGRHVKGPEVQAGSMMVRMALGREAQWVWSGLLVVGGAVLAGYPWLRAAPAESLLVIVGLTPGPWAAVTIVAAFALLGPVLGRWTASAPATAVTLLVAAGLALPSPGLTVIEHQRLTASEPQIALELEAPVSAGAVIVDSYLSHGTRVAAGDTVAIVRLIDDRGRGSEWELRSGVDTGEWAARRPDVAATPGLVTPSSWTSWVVGEREFFGQRYRAAHRLAEPIEARRVEVWLDGQVDPEVALDLMRLEFRP